VLKGRYYGKSPHISEMRTRWEEEEVMNVADGEPLLGTLRKGGSFALAIRVLLSSTILTQAFSSARFTKGDRYTPTLATIPHVILGYLSSEWC